MELEDAAGRGERLVAHGREAEVVEVRPLGQRRTAVEGMGVVVSGIGVSWKIPVVPHEEDPGPLKAARRGAVPIHHVRVAGERRVVPDDREGLAALLEPHRDALPVQCPHCESRVVGVVSSICPHIVAKAACASERIRGVVQDAQGGRGERRHVDPDVRPDRGELEGGVPSDAERVVAVEGAVRIAKDEPSRVVGDVDQVRLNGEDQGSDLHLLRDSDRTYCARVGAGRHPVGTGGAHCYRHYKGDCCADRVSVRAVRDDYEA